MSSMRCRCRAGGYVLRCEGVAGSSLLGRLLASLLGALGRLLGAGLLARLGLLRRGLLGLLRGLALLRRLGLLARRLLRRLRLLGRLGFLGTRLLGGLGLLRRLRLLRRSLLGRRRGRGDDGELGGVDGVGHGDGGELGGRSYTHTGASNNGKLAFASVVVARAVAPGLWRLGRLVRCAESARKEGVISRCRRCAAAAEPAVMCYAAKGWRAAHFLVAFLPAFLAPLVAFLAPAFLPALGFFDAGFLAAFAALPFFAALGFLPAGFFAAFDFLAALGFLAPAFLAALGFFDAFDFFAAAFLAGDAVVATTASLVVSTVSDMVMVGNLGGEATLTQAHPTTASSRSHRWWSHGRWPQACGDWAV